MSLFHSDETFMCMHAQEVFFFFQIRSIKRPVTFFKNGCKKIVFITKCNEKIVWNALLLKKLSASPKNGNPPDKKIMVCPLEIWLGFNRKILKLDHDIKTITSHLYQLGY